MSSLDFSQMAEWSLYTCVALSLFYILNAQVQDRWDK
jgi:hypothetical protein